MRSSEAGEGATVPVGTSSHKVKKRERQDLKYAPPETGEEHTQHHADKSDVSTFGNLRNIRSKPNKPKGGGNDNRPRAIRPVFQLEPRLACAR